MVLSYRANEALSLLWQATWQSTVLAALVAVVILASRRWFAAKWRVVLWTLPMLRMLVVVVPSSSFSVFNATEYLAEARVMSPIAATQENEPSALSPLSAGIPTGEEVRQSAYMVDLPTNTFIAPSATAVGASETKALGQSSNRGNVTSTIFFLWLIGCAVMAFRWACAAIALRRVMAQCQPLEHELWKQLKPSTIASSRVQAFFPVRCLVSPTHLGPATCGLFSPTILIPQHLVRELTSDQLRAIIHHEYQHIRRFDVLQLGLARCVTTFYWFNPVALVVSRKLRRETELAVDSAIISQLRVPERKAYGQLLIQLARHPGSRFGLVQMADCKSDLRARIEEISCPSPTSPKRSAVAIAMIAALLIVGCTQERKTDSQAAAVQPTRSPKSTPNTSDQATSEPTTNFESATKTAPAEQKYYITGTVRDSVTNEPIAGAEVGLLVSSEQLPEKRGPKGVSDLNGKYRIEVPMGSVKLWFPRLKPGYWLSNEDAMMDLVTSPEHPEVVHDIIAKKSLTWRIHAIGELGVVPMLAAMEESDSAKRAAFINGENVTWNKSPEQAYSHVDSSGRGALTQVGTSGEMVITIVNVQAELLVDEGFDNTRVVSAERLPDSATTEMIDHLGKQAKVTEATVILENGSPLLTFQLKSSTLVAMQKLTGRVVDDKEKPIPATRVGVACGSKNAGSSVFPQHSLTDDDGRFEMNIPIQESFGENIVFAAIVTKDGFAAMDTQYIDCTKDFHEINFGTLKLATGHSLPVQVVDANGKAVAGATIEPGGNYALRSQAVRSDAAGRATLRNMPTGVIRVTATHGNLVAESKLVIGSDESDNIETKIKLAELRTPSPVNMPSMPIAVGTTAPDWESQGWSDGKQRQIADYRGKVLVLDFWGMWCGPCVQAIPSMQALAEKYEPKEVVFLGIHTPDGEFDQIVKVKKLSGWTAPSAIDRGTSINDGTTGTSYGVRGYPSFVIIGRDGKVAYNSGIEPKDRNAYMQEMNELAKSNGITWPPDDDTPPAERDQNMNRFMQLLIGREIERLLD